MVNQLASEKLLEAAINKTGLDDFGDESFLQDFQKTIQAVDRETEFSLSGLAMFEQTACELLVNRLRMFNDIKLHPEIAEEKLHPPILIKGLPRTGTSKLQRVISSSESVLPLRFWKLINPAPFPDTAHEPSDPRITVAQELESFIRRVYPEAWAAHPTPALEVEEDLYLHEMTYLAPTIPMRLGAERLLDELTPIQERLYEFLRLVLKYLQWQEGSKDRFSRPWVLKSPIHIGNLAAFQKVFPGAKIIHCHRDVQLSMTSMARLGEVGQLMYRTTVDKAVLGNQVLGYWSQEWEKNIAQRAELEKHSFCDVTFGEINRNALAVVEQIFSFANLNFDEATQDSIKQWEASNQRHLHGEHKYRAEDYGISTGRIREAFACYYDHFAGSSILDP